MFALEKIQNLIEVNKKRLSKVEKHSNSVTNPNSIHNAQTVAGEIRSTIADLEEILESEKKKYVFTFPLVIRAISKEEAYKQLKAIITDGGSGPGFELQELWILED